MVKKTIAGEKTHKLVLDVMKKYHYELFEAEISVTVFMAEKIDKEGNSVEEYALVKNGQSVAVQIRKANQRELGLGSGLLIIEIDSLRWDTMLLESQIALIDHELCHFRLKRDKKTGAIKLDGNDKPMLQGVHHDAEIGIFTDVIRRHGMLSIDYKQTTYVHGLVTEALLDNHTEHEEDDE